MSATTSVGHVRVQRETSFLRYFLSKSRRRKKKPFRERTVSGAARQEEIFETPHNFHLQFVSPLHLSRLVSTCKWTFRGCLTCELRMRGGHWMDTQDLHKDPTTSPADKIQTVVPKMRVPGNSVFSPQKQALHLPPATYRSSTKKAFESTHTHHFAEHTLLLFSFYFVYKLRNTSYHLIDMFFGGLLVQRRLSRICQTASPWNNKSSNRIVATQ